MTPAQFEDLYAYCVKLFGDDRVLVDLKGQTTFEVTVHPEKADSINLGIYGGDHPKSFMDIEDFTFEYGDKEAFAVSEMKKYLKAAAEGKLSIQTKKIFGITISKRLVIEGGESVR